MQCLATQVADTVSSFCSLFHSLSTIEEESTKYIFKQLHEICLGTHSNNGKNLFHVLSSEEAELTKSVLKTHFMYCPVQKQN